MKLIKAAFLVGLLIVLGSAATFAMYNRGAFNQLHLDEPPLANFYTSQVKSKLPSSLPDFNNLPSSIANLFAKKNTVATETASSASTPSATTTSTATTTTNEELQTLASRGQEVSQQIGKVLGDYVQINEADSSQPLSEKAFEYGRYLYCQQVVKDYEASEKARQTSSPTP